MATHPELQRKEVSRLHFLSFQTAFAVLLLLPDVQRLPQPLNQVQLNLGMTQINNETQWALTALVGQVVVQVGTWTKQVGSMYMYDIHVY